MRILTLGDSWTYGAESSDPKTMSWPAQLATKYGIEVVNLAQGGSSNQRAVRIGIEELCRDNNYDWVIWGIAPASRNELLKQGKWHQVWPRAGQSEIDRIYTEFWHAWNDVQLLLLLTVQFLSVVKMRGCKLLVSSLSIHIDQYKKELSWIQDYKNDCDFRSLDMPLHEFDIGIEDLDRKLRSLKAIHDLVLLDQPDFLFDVYAHMRGRDFVAQHGNVWAPHGHPNDQGYAWLADYFASKLLLDI